MSEIERALVGNLSLVDIDEIRDAANGKRARIFNEHGWVVPERDFTAGDVRIVLDAYASLRDSNGGEG